jgi:hypothetical protein
VVIIKRTFVIASGTKWSEAISMLSGIFLYVNTFANERRKKALKVKRAFVVVCQLEITG